jgi:hypothetical protein
MLRETLSKVLSIIMLVLGLVFLIGIINLSSDWVLGSGQHLIGQIFVVGSLVLLVTGIIGLIVSFKS